MLPPNSKQRRTVILQELQSLALGDALPTDNELDSYGITATTVLFIPGELQNIARRAAPAAETGGKTALLNSLKREAENVEPTIRLGTYRSRFRWGRDDGSMPDSNQEPYTEFLLLLHVLFESGRLITEEETRLLSQCAKSLPSDPGEMKKKLSGFVKDATILEGLNDAFVEALK